MEHGPNEKNIEKVIPRESDGKFSKGFKSGFSTGPAKKIRAKIRNKLMETFAANDFEKFDRTVDTLYHLATDGKGNTYAIKLIFEHILGKPDTKIEADINTNVDDMQQILKKHLKDNLGLDA